MHHYIFPAKDTYVTNLNGLEDKNFGIDEILQVGTNNMVQQVLSQTRDYVYTDIIFSGVGVNNFSGQFTGSFGGTIASASGSISGSNLDFTASYFSGSIDGTSSIVSGSVLGTSVVGYLNGSVIAPYVIGNFIGQINGADACLTGTGSGTDTRTEANWITDTLQYVDRALLKFDLTAISAAITAGSIVNPRFSLKLKICNEYNLPITYNIYAFPISQSWTMGDGYFSDGGSDSGTSWIYRDANGGIAWYSSSYNGGYRHAIDFISNPNLLTASFAYGGGTWYTSSWCSQSFEYKSADIDMDVTTMALGWITGSFPNEGLILVSSDELQATGYGFTLKFFSRDTNTIYSPYLDVMWDDIALNGGYVTGSTSTGSVVITTISSGISASIQSGSSFSISGGISGSFSSSVILSLTHFADIISGSGFANGGGLTGNIIGLPVYGVISASIDVSQSLVTGPCGKSFSASMASASFYTGPFSGSMFYGYYVDYKFENAFLTGSWTQDALLGARVYIALPSTISPYTYAYVVGTYINGTALGLYVTSGSTSASFNGQFVDGNLIGGVLSLQLSGSVYTSSFTYTSSVAMTSSMLTAMDATKPFTVVLQNVHPTYKAGDIAKFGVFARKKFPLKYFGRSTQQEQYVVPEYLPTSSYYALKDNETGEIVMDFDSYTKIGSEYPNGNYFIIDTTSLAQERYYRVLIRVEDGQSIYTFDTGKTFKVTR